MSQVTDLTVANSTGLAVRQGFNDLVQAVNSQHSGATAPTATVPYMLWADTSGTPAVLKIRNAADDGWLLLGTLDEATGQFLSNGQISGRNLIINGSGRINQRGYTSGAATSGANQFTLDRWFVQTSAQNLSFTGNDSRRVMTAPAGGVAQVIEGVNIIGGTYVLNWDGTATATVGGTARTKGETFTLTANTNVKIVFSGGTFTDVQLEAGSVATPFESRSVASEFALCARYYQIAFMILGTQVFGGAGGALNQMTLATEMRATPSVQLVPNSGTGGSVVTLGAKAIRQNALHSAIVEAMVNLDAEITS